MPRVWKMPTMPYPHNLKAIPLTGMDIEMQHLSAGVIWVVGKNFHAIALSKLANANVQIIPE